MDPTETLKQIKAALKEGDIPTACELASGLLSWIKRGGFAPLGETAETTRSVCVEVLRRPSGD